MSAEQFQIADIRVEGLQRIAPGTVFNYLPVQVGDTVGDDVTGNIIRALYQTGFFEDVRVERDGSVLVLSVQERPSIAKIEFVGNKDIDAKSLEKGMEEIGLKEGRVFNRSVLDRIEQELERQYYARGKYGVLVTSTVSPLARNRVAIRIDVTEGLTARIKQINLIGNKAFDSKALLKLFELGTTSWYSFYAKNDQYSRQKLGGDLERLRSFYLDRGFIKFDIKSTQVSISADKKEIYITVVMDEGSPYTISDIKLAGQPAVPVAKVIPLIQLRRGEPFSRKLTTESSERIQSLLGDEGYAFANVNPSTEINDTTKQVAVTFFVDPGKRVYVRRVNMKGNTRTRDEVLRREMRQLESAWFSAALVKESRERLNRLGYFDDVTTETPAVAGSADQVDVDINVKEKPAGNLMAGIGYSQSQGILLNASINQNNFLGTGKRVSLAFNTSTATTLYQFSYLNPYYTVDGISRGFDLSYRKTDFTKLLNTTYTSYTTDVGVAGVNFGLPISHTSRAGFGLRYENTKIQYDKLTAPLYAPIVVYFTAKNGSVYDDFIFSAGYSNDTRDRAVFPTSGYQHSLHGEVSIPGSTLTYYQIGYEGTRYIPLFSKVVLAVFGDVGYGDGYSNLNSLPFFKNYYAGGPHSVRGFVANSLGPRELSLNYGPSGGNLKMVGSLELSAPPPMGGEIEKTLRVGVFLDAGNVWVTQNLYQALIYKTGFNLGEVRYSTGVAINWLSPIGALSISLGFPLNAKPGDDKQMFQFGVGQTF
ncbi:outer membrane protein assembly factor BamA [uncultured Thiodictyon sp.]|uniref:outer membrane protein assembly factor BamA n=1 Tax=uncultured Thiodictyon sp. TaxID=1846217 RepID=UPI0025E89F2B|nr:outer membrane protein assembly factor BamA [uncultured Thiodictyon sp.]